MSKCKFDRAWAGICNKETDQNNDMCNEHINKKCISCGKPATKECPETFQFVCGAPLCDTCVHSISERYSHVTIDVYEAQKKECKQW